MDKRYIYYLVVPLAVVFFLSTLVAWGSTIRDFALSVAVETLSLLATVLYVDWAIRERDKATWRRATRYIAAEISQFATMVYFELPAILGFGLDLSWGIQLGIFAAEELAAAPKSLFVGAGTVATQETILSELRATTLDGWQGSILFTRDKIDEANQLVDRHGPRLSPSQLSDLLEMREALNRLDIMSTSGPITFSGGMSITEVLARADAGALPKEWAEYKEGLLQDIAEELWRTLRMSYRMGRHPRA